MMWLPRPITHPSPIRSTGSGPRSWPGAMPAQTVTWSASMVRSPITIHCSP